MEEYLVIQDLFKCTHIGAQIHFCGMLVNGGKMWEYFGTGATGAHWYRFPWHPMQKNPTVSDPAVDELKQQLLI